MRTKKINRILSTPEQLEKRRGYLRSWKLKNKDRYNAQQREYNNKPENRGRINQNGATRRKKARKQVLTELGGRCKCCGEDTYEFLSIDHIHSGGRKEATKNKEKRLHIIVVKEGIPKDKYQVLCHNCNLAKGFYGYCPHTKTTVDSIL